MPDWAADMSYLGDALKGAWGREPSSPAEGPGAVHNGAGATDDEDADVHNGAGSGHGADGGNGAGVVAGGSAEPGEDAPATREA
jgi:hypothetical protein